MLAVSTASRLVVTSARRAVVVSSQRQGVVQVIRRTSVRGFQSIAQTDRVSIFDFNLEIFYYFTVYD